MTLAGIVGSERSVCRVAPFAILGRMALLGGSFTGTPLLRVLLGHELSRLGGCCSLGLVGSGLSRIGASLQVGGVTR